jgi:hypothetical protein
VKLDDTRQDNDGFNETFRVELDAVVKDVKIQRVRILLTHQKFMRRNREDDGQKMINLDAMKAITMKCLSYHKIAPTTSRPSSHPPNIFSLSMLFPFRLSCRLCIGSSIVIHPNIIFCLVLELLNNLWWLGSK